MRVFILGATGFIGTHIVQKLLEEGHSVVGVARDEKGFAKFGGGVAVVKGDITEPETWRNQMARCDASINLVGLIRETKSKGLTYERVVVQGTKNWIRECEDAGVKRAVYVSAIGADPKGTGYQRSKWAAEQATRNGKPLAHLESVAGAFKPMGRGPRGRTKTHKDPLNRIDSSECPSQFDAFPTIGR